jgi:hypothetical protein
MRKYHLDTGGMSDETSFRAICRSYQCLSSKGRLKNEIGDILIPEKYCRVGIISHECCHAAIYYFKEKGLVVNDETEEQFCLIQGDLNRQLVNGYYKWVNRT